MQYKLKMWAFEVCCSRYLNAYRNGIYTSLFYIFVLAWVRVIGLRVRWPSLTFSVNYITSRCPLSQWYRLEGGRTFKTPSGAKAIVQGRIYVANEYPTTVLATMSIVSLKNLGFRPKLSWIEEKSVCFDEKQADLRYKIQILQLFSNLLSGVKNATPLNQGVRMIYLTPCLNMPLQ